MLGKLFNKLLNKKVAAPILPEPASANEYKRFNDAIIIILQDNTNKSLPVTACNERAASLIGYSEKDVATKDFRDLLPLHIQELVNEYIEFKENGRRIDQILRKIPNFELRAADGKNIPVNLRIIRGVSDSTHISYRLVITDTSLLEVLQKERAKYSTLNSKEYLLRDMQHIINHSSTYGYESCFAVISFFDGQSHIKRIEKMIESSKRNTDIIGAWNESTIIYIMPDTQINNCIIPLERFKSSLPADLKQDLIIRYCQISNGIEPATQIRNCAEAITGFDL